MDTNVMINATQNNNHRREENTALRFAKYTIQSVAFIESKENKRYKNPT